MLPDTCDYIVGKRRWGGAGSWRAGNLNGGKGVGGGRFFWKHGVVPGGAMLFLRGDHSVSRKLQRLLQAPRVDEPDARKNRHVPPGLK